jgi:hexosaminidase
MLLANSIKGSFFKIVFFTVIVMTHSCNDRPPTHAIAVIPEPVGMELNEGFFSINEETTVFIQPETKELASLAGMLISKIATAGGPELGFGGKAGSNVIRLQIAEGLDEIGDEGYNLEVTSRYVNIEANTGAGIFYGLHTLFQLLPEIIESGFEICENSSLDIPSVKIKDYPRFSYRGLHLDVGRHLFPVAFIKKYIDLLASYKMNTFHWHLTEDQGWRLEVAAYPLLTESGAWRKSTPVGRNEGQDSIPYGGFYTQAEAREIVDYAAKRYVRVIPEIELPGHSQAALAAYPHLSCTGGPFEVHTRWGVSNEIYCAGNEEVFTFLENVLDEVLHIFPSEYIHIGGDEAPKMRWENCPKCRERIKNEQLADEHELQSWFVQRIERYLNSKGRKIIGWDEILEGGLAPNATVMSWRGTSGGIAAAQLGHDVIMTPGAPCYFDHYQANPDNEPLAICCFNPLHKVYEYEPIPEELSEHEAKHVLGAQGNVWTEYIKTSDHVEYMAYPRAMALAEVLWTPKGKRNWNNFLERLKAHFVRLDYKRVNYHPTPYLPEDIDR